MRHESLQELSGEELDRTFRTNVYAMFYLCKAAEPHMKPGAPLLIPHLYTYKAMIFEIKYNSRKRIYAKLPAIGR
jgi:NAD(P)-dependent dehydrogenase (short-subunit alcohol dehydrogenase family)